MFKKLNKQTLFYFIRNPYHFHPRETDDVYSSDWQWISWFPRTKFPRRDPEPDANDATSGFHFDGIGFSIRRWSSCVRGRRDSGSHPGVAVWLDLLLKEDYIIYI